MKAVMKRFVCCLLVSVLVLGALPMPAMAAAAYSMDCVNIAPIEDQLYTGAPVMPDVTVTCGQTTLSEGTDYELSYSDNTEIGSACVTVIGRGRYQGERSAYFSIGKEDISNATITGISDSTYSYANFVSPYTKPVTVTLNGKTLEEDVDYEVWYYSNFGIGTATLKIVGIGSYCGSIDRQFTIKAPPVSGSTTSMTLSSFNKDKTTTISEGDSVSFLMTNLNTDGFTASYTVRNSSYSQVSSGSVSSCSLSDSGKRIGSYTPLSTGTYTIQYKVTGYTLRSVMVSGVGYQYMCYPKSYGSSYSQTLVVKARPAQSTPTGSVTSLTFDKFVESGPNTLELKVNTAVTPNTPSSGCALKWTSSNPRVATVDSTGTVTLTGTGSAAITATAPNDVSVTIPLTIESIDLPGVEKGACVYRTDKGYELSLATDKGVLTEGRDYTVSYEESGSQVIATVTGCGQFDGELTYTFERPIIGDYSGTVTRSGDFIVDIAPRRISSPVQIVTAAIDGDGVITDIHVDRVEDLTQGYSRVSSLEPPVLGSYRVFFLDGDTLEPLSDNQTVSTIVQPTDDELYDVYNFLRNYTMENDESTTSSFYAASFSGNGRTAELRYYGASRGELNVCYGGTGYAINYYFKYDFLEPSGFEKSFSYSTYLENGEHCYAFYRLDPVRYMKGGSPTSIAYYNDKGPDTEEEAQQLERQAMARFDSIIEALSDFLERNGYSLTDMGMCSFHANEQD